MDKLDFSLLSSRPRSQKICRDDEDAHASDVAVQTFPLPQVQDVSIDCTPIEVYFLFSCAFGARFSSLFDQYDAQALLVYAG